MTNIQEIPHEHKIEGITFINDFMYLFIDGNRYEIDLHELAKKSDLLLNAKPEERACFRETLTGDGILWTAIGEALSINSLMKIGHKISY